MASTPQAQQLGLVELFAVRARLDNNGQRAFPAYDLLVVVDQSSLFVSSNSSKRTQRGRAAFVSFCSKRWARR